MLIKWEFLFDLLFEVWRIRAFFMVGMLSFSGNKVGNSVAIQDDGDHLSRLETRTKEYNM